MKKAKELEEVRHESFEIEELDDFALINTTGGFNLICPDFNFVAGCGGSSSSSK